MCGLLIVVASFVALPGESHRQSSLAGYSLFGHKELDTTERLTLSLPYATTLMDFKDILLSEISQTQKDKYYLIPLMRYIK